MKPIRFGPSIAGFISVIEEPPNDSAIRGLARVRDLIIDEVRLMELDYGSLTTATLKRGGLSNWTQLVDTLTEPPRVALLTQALKDWTDLPPSELAMYISLCHLPVTEKRPSERKVVSVIFGDLGSILEAITMGYVGGGKLVRPTT